MRCGWRPLAVLQARPVAPEVACAHGAGVPSLRPSLQRRLEAANPGICRRLDGERRLGVSCAETTRRRAAKERQKRGRSEVFVVPEQWIEEEAQIRLMIDGSAPDGGAFSHLCATSKRPGGPVPYPRLLCESSHRFHIRPPSAGEVMAGQSSAASMEAQLEAKGGRLEVAKIEAILRARGFVPVTQEPIWQQKWVKLVRMSA
jgi:hypothetical protein